MLKYLFSIAIVSLIAACGSEKGDPGVPGERGRDGINGKDGKNGTNGTNGNDGTNGKDGNVVIAQAVASILSKRAAVLDIECSSGWRGTGVKLNDGRVLTAMHVADGCESVTYYSGTVAVGKGGLIAPNSRDIAYISNVTWTAHGKSIAGVTPMTDWNPVVGDITFTVSLPDILVSDPQVSIGYITDEFLNAGSAWPDAFMTDAAASGGSSGAPVFNLKGELVGIHVGGWSTGGLELNVQLPL
jgi:S1-C subfamily serine protease